MKLVVVVLAAALAAPAAVEESDFRWERTLTAPSGGHVTFEADGPMYEHSRPDLSDLRILDGDGRQVPRRALPPAADRAVKEVAPLNAGRRGRGFVALLDLGPRRAVRNRAELLLADTRQFVGRVVVFGSDDRRSFTRLSSTQVWNLRGATAAASTTLVFPPTDHRFLRLEGTGAPIPDTVGVYFERSRPRLEPVDSAVSVQHRGSETLVTVDVGYANLPVDVLRFQTTTRRFDRELFIEATNGEVFSPFEEDRILRLGGVQKLDANVSAQFARLRITIENRDDEPLSGLRVQALAQPRTLVLEEGYDPPYRVLYGNPSIGSPDYDFARVPRAELRPLAAGNLFAERPNPAYEAPEDTRSFLERNPRLVEGSLALVALALGVGGFFALRRRA
ncbi:MAG: hypothetical protein ACRDNH_11985 [Gaiellaceae bacterium]